MRFTDIVTDAEELRQLLGQPAPLSTAKCLPALDRHARAFIERSPFVLIASSNARGQTDVSPKGDPPGFVRVLDDTTLAIPDRLGNRRADTFLNILDNPRVGLLFLVPGKSESLRVNGAARIVRDAALRESMAVRGKTPDLALAVEVEEAFFHCSKCMIRSSLWKPEAWPPLHGLPTLAEALTEAAGIPVEELETLVEKSERERLY